MTGEDTFENRRTLLYAAVPSGSGYSLELVGQFPDLSKSGAAWGDYDNDGDLDLALIGQSDDVLDGVQQSYTWIFVNDGLGSFTRGDQDLIGLNNGDLAWADFDNDQDLDLAVTGSSATGSRELRVYRNDDGSLVDAELGLAGLESSDLAWADFDGDGDPDLVAGGIGDGGVRTTLYVNDGSGGLEPLAGLDLPGIRGGDLAWGDYDNDQDLDLIIVGNDGQNPFVSIYEYKDDTLVPDNIPILQGLDFSAVSFADIEGDGDLDLISTGRDISLLTQAVVNDNLESQFNPNRPPESPSIGSAVDAGDSVQLSWQQAEDEFDATPASLTYNLRVGTLPGSGDVLSGNIPLGPGNAGHNLSHRLGGLASGTYYWSAQSIDDGFARSSWSATNSFIIDTVQPQVTAFNLSGQELGIGQTVNLALTFLDEHSGVDVTVEPQVTATIGDQTYPFESLQFTGATWSGALTIAAEMPSGAATISVSGAIDGKGNLLIPFATEDAFTIDTDLPIVSSSSPADGATDISVDLEEVTITFSESLDPKTVTANNFEIELGSQILEQIPEPTYVTETNTVRFFPIAGVLVSGSQYKIEISAAIQDLTGNRPDNAVALSFDTRTPQLLELFPVDGDSLVPSGQTPLVATFDAPLLATALDDAQAVQLLRENQAELLRDQPRFSEATGELTFEPAAGLRPGSRYEVILAGNLAGPLRVQEGGDFRWSFQTITPELLSKSPQGTTADAGTAQIEATFSAPIDVDLLSTETVRISREGEPETIADGSLDFDAETGVLSFQLERGLKPGSRYEVILDGSLAGPLQAVGAGDFTWQFQTVVPELLSKSPEGEVGAASERIEATFSAPIDDGLLDATTVRIAREGVPEIIAEGSLDFDPETNILSFALESGLKPGSRYEIVLAGSLAGPLQAVGAGDFTWQFQMPVPQLAATSPERDAVDLSTADATLTATFDNPIDPDLLVADNVSLLKSGTEEGISELDYNPETKTARFSVTEGLRAGTSYEVRIARTVGGPLRQEAYSWAFQTAVPQVATVLPEADATNVEIALAQAVVSFSAPLDADQVTTDNFLLLREGQAVELRPDDPLPLGDGRYALAPAADWQVGSRYSVQISPTVSGPLGTGQQLGWSFSTAAPDTVAVSPAAGDSAVSSLTETVIATFDNPIDEASLDIAGNVQLFQEGRPLEIEETRYDADSRTVTIVPLGGLRAGTGYQARIGAAVGGPLRQEQGDFLWDFSTRIPSPISVDPADGSSTRSGDRRLQVTFSGPIDRDLMTPQNFRLSRSGVTVELDPNEFDYVAETYTVSYPNVDLQPGSEYQAAVSSRVSGPLGGDLPDLEWTFRTQVPQVVSTWPADGADGVSTSTAALQVVFSEPVASQDAAAFQLLARSLADTTAPPELVTIASPTARDSGDVFVLNFAPKSGRLQPFTEYQVSIAREVLGELATAGFGWTFRTAGLLEDAVSGGPVTNASGSVELYFPPNALASGAREVLIRRLPESEIPGKFAVQQTGLTRVSSAYEISTSGDLLKPVTLTLHYTEAELDDRDPSKLGIFRHQGGQWQRIGGSGAGEKNAVRTAVEQLGVFALFEDLATPVGDLAIRALDCQPRAFAPTAGDKSETDISFQLTGAADITVRVYNASGRLERVIARNEPMAPGRISLSWDGRDEDREMVASGLYIVVVNAGDNRREKVVSVVR